MQNYKTSRITCKRKKPQFLELDNESLDIIKRKKKSAIKYEDLIHIVFLINMHDNNFLSCQWCEIIKAFFLALNCLIANSK